MGKQGHLSSRSGNRFDTEEMKNNLTNYDGVYNIYSSSRDSKYNYRGIWALGINSLETWGAVCSSSRIKVAEERRRNKSN